MKYRENEMGKDVGNFAELAVPNIPNIGDVEGGGRYWPFRSRLNVECAMNLADCEYLLSHNKMSAGENFEICLNTNVRKNKNTKLYFTEKHFMNVFYKRTEIVINSRERQKKHGRGVKDNGNSRKTNPAGSFEE